MLSGKKIIVGICGSISAYKAAFLVRLLVKEGADVQVVMTPDAIHFITPLTLSTLSKKPVLVEYFDAKNGTWNNHVELSLWADMILIAPASANTLAKMANGLCDNLLLAIYLSAKCPVYFAPAMDLDMWKHPATMKNVALLESFGNHQIKPGTGELASGLSGEGRLAEPDDIILHLKNSISYKRKLVGKKALVTAGPTHEAIDPVRFIGNHSSGKMGFALAEALRLAGAEVTLITGPHSLTPVHSDIKKIEVVSAEEMLNACFAVFTEQNIVVMAAAVADYKPVLVAKNKIKKDEQEFSIDLVKTTDILKRMGQQKSPEQTLVGFALETEHEKEHALKKLHAKNLDLIILNSLNDAGAGFKTDTNQVTIIDRNENVTSIALKSKKDVADDIVQKIIETIAAEKPLPV